MNAKQYNWKINGISYTVVVCKSAKKEVVNITLNSDLGYVYSNNKNSQMFINFTERMYFSTNPISFKNYKGHKEFLRKSYFIEFIEWRTRMGDLGGYSIDSMTYLMKNEILREIKCVSNIKLMKIALCSSLIDEQISEDNHKVVRKADIQEIIKLQEFHQVDPL